MIVPFPAALAPAAAVLHDACFPVDPWPAEAFTALLASDAYGFGWVEDKTLKGLILARDALDEAEILTFAVDPACRRQGIGTQLLLAVCARCKAQAVTSLFLEVAQNNDAARDLYAGLGFKQVGERSSYYVNGTRPVDALILLKII